MSIGHFKGAYFLVCGSGKILERQLWKPAGQFEHVYHGGGVCCLGRAGGETLPGVFKQEADWRGAGGLEEIFPRRSVWTEL